MHDCVLLLAALQHVERGAVGGPLDAALTDSLQVCPKPNPLMVYISHTHRKQQTHIHKSILEDSDFFIITWPSNNR